MVADSAGNRNHWPAARRGAQIRMLPSTGLSRIAGLAVNAALLRARYGA
ncbi:MAG: hypothetical protein KA387_06200 [Rubrivivax sp.]|nr:hypothetical protein [Rubrivivax sp.]